MIIKKTNQLGNFRRGINLYVPKRRKKQSFLPSSLGGLALWLKADTGVTLGTYVSQIILTCTGGFSSYSGTYIATSTPDADGVYTLFSSSNSKTIIKDGDFFFDGNLILVSSGDGISWSFQNILVAGLTISGAGGSHTGANGVYLLNERNESSGDIYRNNENGYYGLVNTNGVVEIYSPDYSRLYYNSSFGSGAWTNDGGTGTVTASSITLDPSGTVSGSITTSPSSTVTAWADQSENGNYVSAYNNPQLITNQINGKPVIDFNASQYFASNNQNLNNNSSIFFVVKSRGNHGIMLSTSDYEGLVFALTSNPNNSFSVGISNLFEIANDGADNGNNWMIGSTIRSNNLTSIIYKNGTQVANGNYDTSSLNPTAPLIIGADADLNSYWNLDGQIAEIIIYNRALTISERQQVEAYLNDKYEIY